MKHFVNNSIKYDTPLFLGDKSLLWDLYHVETIECRTHTKIEIGMIT